MWEDPGAQIRPVHSLSAPIPSGLARRPRSPGCRATWMMRAMTASREVGLSKWSGMTWASSASSSAAAALLSPGATVGRSDHLAVHASPRAGRMVIACR